MAKVATADAQRFMAECLKAVGAGNKQALQQAKLLIEADKCGHPSHGLSRLEMYVNEIVEKVCMPNNTPKILKENEGTAWVDANNVLGATAGHFGMDLAIEKACNAGVGWVSVKGSNHNGMLGYWAKQAANQGLIGMAFTNTSPFLAPPRSRKARRGRAARELRSRWSEGPPPQLRLASKAGQQAEAAVAALGTNPLSVVAVGSKNEMFYLDMATTAVSFGTIEMMREIGAPLPAGWAQGPDGKDTLDPELACKTRCLMPLGGRVAGHKGFGLAATVELFCGILSGSCYAHNIRSWSHAGAGGPANLGQCYIAVNPDSFAPGFGDRLTESILFWRNMDPTDPCRPVLAPGDKELQATCEAEKSGTVSFVKQQIESSAALAKKLKVKPMTVT